MSWTCPNCERRIGDNTGNCPCGVSAGERIAKLEAHAEDVEESNKQKQQRIAELEAERDAWRDLGARNTTPHGEGGDVSEKPKQDPYPSTIPLLWQRIAELEDTIDDLRMETDSAIHEKVIAHQRIAKLEAENAALRRGNVMNDRETDALVVEARRAALEDAARWLEQNVQVADRALEHLRRMAKGET